MSVLILPAATNQPELLWVPIIMGLAVVLMMIPFELLARADRAQLRSDLEDVLRRAGSISVA
jgi:inner membrane protein involved in colicin E2 resistance